MGTTTRLDPEVTVALQGTLDTFALPDVLRLLAATKKSGRLRITGPRGTGSVSVDAGGIGLIEAPHAPHATEPVDVLFELLRFEQGSFTFDADVAPDPAGATGELEDLLTGAEALLVEWREIESVVPSMDAWVTLRRSLASPEVSIEASHWMTVVAIGSGATVRRMSDELCLAELPASRAVRDLSMLGLIDIEASAPVGRVPARIPRAPEQPTPPSASETGEPDTEEVAAVAASADSVPAPAAETVIAADAPLPTARPLRARRANGAAHLAEPSDSEPFVPLELPGQGPMASYDPTAEESEVEDAAGATAGVGDLVAAFPGLANRAADPTPEDEELARQLATLSPRAAEAVRAAAEATTVEERDAALAEAEEGEEQPISRGLLLKFLSSVKS